MMPYDAFRPPWKFLAQLFGQFCRISKFGIVHVDVFCDDRFDPPADPIGRFSLLKPDWPAAIRRVGGLDLREW